MIAGSLYPRSPDGLFDNIQIKINIFDGFFVFTFDLFLSAKRVISQVKKIGKRLIGLHAGFTLIKKVYVTTHAFGVFIIFT